MEINKKNQKAGDNSQQIQANTVVVNYGIDEKRAREICKEEFAVVRQDWTKDALAIAEHRVQDLEDKIIPKIIEHDSSLKIFGDPSFQFTLRKAQIAAASSGSECDLDMLSELILHRAEENGNRGKTLGISKAIEIIDQIPESSLIGLSIFYAVSRYSPTDLDVNSGLAALDNLYRKIINNNHLPNGIQWVENLDILSAVRLSPSGINSFKKLDEFMPKKLSMYIPMGVKIGSEGFNDMLIKLNKSGLYIRDLPEGCSQDISQSAKLPIVNMPLFKQHPFKEGFVVCMIPPYYLKELKDGYFFVTEEFQVPISDEQYNAILNASQITYEDGSSDPELKSKLMKEWDKYPCLNQIHLWWDSLSTFFTVTPVGEAVANAYIRTKDSIIPNL